MAFLPLPLLRDPQQLAQSVKGVLLLLSAAALSACEVEGQYSSDSLLSHGPLSVKAPNEYGGYTGVSFVVAAKDETVHISCSSSRLAISRTVLLEPEGSEKWRCSDIERDLKPGESLSLRFQFPHSMLDNKKLRSREGQPERIKLLLQTYKDGKWSTLTYPFELDHTYRIVIPFSKG